MPKPTLTPRLLAEYVAASPEGFFNQSELYKFTTGAEATVQLVAEAAGSGGLGCEGYFVFDVARLSPEQVRERSALYNGSLPQLRKDGGPFSHPIAERIAQRQDRLSKLDDAVLLRLVNAFENTAGYLTVGELCTEPGDEGALATLFDMNVLKRSDDLIFDPLRISRLSLKDMRHTQIIMPVREQLIALLESRPGQTASRIDLVERLGANIVQMVLDTGGFVVFSVPTPTGDSVWVRLKAADAVDALHIAQESVQPKDSDWEALLLLCGDTRRPSGSETTNEPVESTARERVMAHTYTLNSAASRLKMRRETIQSAILEKLLTSFIDPDGTYRISAGKVEAVLQDPVALSDVGLLELISIRELAIVMDEPTRTVRQKLRKGRISANHAVRWRKVAGWDGLPDTLDAFRALYAERKSVWVEEREVERKEERRKLGEQRDSERTRRDEQRRQRTELRARLLAAFPAWQHAGRVDQRVILHVGPPNSGKTHTALDILSIANSGWYLAPLRLLAFEVFDRLNQRGIPCNLLTGEEFFNVPGAQVTAATIEMFNPERSGDCVVIDEAQMLADPDRGWAWTRALMEAQSPEIHVIGPTHARSLIERLASSAAIPMEIMEHQRLAPLAIASDPWPLERLPGRTILVAFSRRVVLHLKTELEMLKRSVSVVYGSLPPEVRRRQADRFAEGKTEICVATDAVGMGLNLPADQVCFFEMDKYDGKSMRPLNAAEVHQIGGRAGRYGLSKVGQVGATNRRNLKALRRVFAVEPLELTHARVAPVVEDLALIPGNLAHRFAQWSELQSIPDSLRNVIRPADIDERIALARMLTDREVEQLGLESAVKIVNAPTKEISRDYWRACTLAILASAPMPEPPEAPYTIENDHHLDETERSIACADIYLWLARRQEFSAFAPDEEQVREVRTQWSMSIDGALLRRLDTLARCVNCRKPLPLGYRYSLCEDCYNRRSNYW